MPCAWIAGKQPASYDCRGKAGRLWDSACDKTVAHYSHTQTSRLRQLAYACDNDGNGRYVPANASSLASLLRGKTIVAIGDSLLHNLYCALSCHLLDAAPSARFNNSRIPGPIPGSVVMRLELGPEASAMQPPGPLNALGSNWIQFVLPGCAAVSSRAACGSQPQSTMQKSSKRDRHPAQNAASYAESLAKSTAVDSATWQLLVLYSSRWN